MWGCWVSLGIVFRPCWSLMVVGWAKAAGPYGLRGLYSRANLYSIWPALDLACLVASRERRVVDFEDVRVGTEVGVAR